MKKIKCTECDNYVNNFIVDDKLIKTYGEGCTYLGHIISKKHAKELKII